MVEVEITYRRKGVWLTSFRHRLHEGQTFVEFTESINWSRQNNQLVSFHETTAMLRPQVCLPAMDIVLIEVVQ